MPAAHVQHTGGGGNSSTYSAALTGVVNGNGIAVWIYWEDSATKTLNSVADGTNTYTILHNPTSQGPSRIAMAYCLNVTGGSLTIVATLSAAEFGNIIVHEFSGCNAFDVSAIGQQNFPGTATDAVRTNAATTTAAGDYIFAAAAKSTAAGDVLSAGTGFTPAQQQNNSGAASFSEYMIQGSAASTRGLFTTSSDGDYLSGFMSFKAGGGATAANWIPRRNAWGQSSKVRRRSSIIVPSLKEVMFYNKKAA